MTSREREVYGKMLSHALQNPSETYGWLPLSDLAALGAVVPFYVDWLKHDTLDDSWEALEPRASLASVAAPALHIGGWYDLFVGGTIGAFTSPRETAATFRARTDQRLVSGPWAHGNFSDTLGELHFGTAAANSAVDSTALHLAFFDRHLRGAAVDIPPVQFFLMGADVWLATHK